MWMDDDRRNEVRHHPGFWVEIAAIWGRTVINWGRSTDKWGIWLPACWGERCDMIGLADWLNLELDLTGGGKRIRA